MLTLIALLLGCNSHENTDDTGLVAPIPELPTAGCGAEAYAWVPLSEVGAVITYEAVPEWSMTADGISTLLGMMDLDGVEVPYGSRVYRVRYLTQDRGALTEATGLVALPDAGEQALSPPTVLYTHPTTGFEDFCAPSQRDIFWAALPIALAGLGYAVAAPDYLGQNGLGEPSPVRHPYLVAEPTAVASLDAVRALWAFPELGPVDPAASGYIVGASQGGGAAVWAERYAPEYLPEFEVRASMISVPVLDLRAWAVEGAQTLSVGSVGAATALASMRDWYRGEAPLSEVIPADQVAYVEEVMATECPRTRIPEGITDLDQVFTSEWQEAAGEGQFWEPWSCWLAENSVGSAPVNRGLGTPILMVIGSADDVALSASQRLAYNELCAEGHEVYGIECRDLGHYEATIESLDTQLAWLRDFEAGVALGTPCEGLVVMDCVAP